MEKNNKTQEVKVVFIGESGCGKSTIIRHLAKFPDELKYVSSVDGSTGTTKVTVEYIFGDFNFIEVESVLCNLDVTVDNTDFAKYLSETDRKQGLNKSNNDYEEMINTYALKYMRSLSLEKIFQEINKVNIFNYISIRVPVNEELYSQMQHNEIDRLKIVDTRGLGDNNNYNRVIPFAGSDAIMIIGKSTPPNPSILDGLVNVCENYSHIPVLFVGTHSFNEDEVDVPSSASIGEYLKKLREYNKTTDCPIKFLYADKCEKHLKLIEPVRKVMKECFINNIPFVKSLSNANAKISNYYKFYIPACIDTFSNCIKTISLYQNAQRKVYDKLNGKNVDMLFKSLYNKNILESIVDLLEVIPKNYFWYVDFISVAKDVSQRENTPLNYSYNCVATTLRLMIFDSIKYVIIDNNEISNDILKFFLKRLLEKNSCNWFLGWESYHSIIRDKYRIVRQCKNRLRNQNLQLDRVICTRFGEEYDQYKSIKILLFEEALRQLLSKVNDDIDINNYFSNNINCNLVE